MNPPLRRVDSNVPHSWTIYMKWFGYDALYESVINDNDQPLLDKIASRIEGSEYIAAHFSDVHYGRAVLKRKYLAEIFFQSTEDESLRLYLKMKHPSIKERQFS